MRVVLRVVLRVELVIGFASGYGLLQGSRRCASGFASGYGLVSSSVWFRFRFATLHWRVLASGRKPLANSKNCQK